MRDWRFCYFSELAENDSHAMECVVTGPVGEWDEAFVMGYPNSTAFLAMVRDPAYKSGVVVHRTAAVKDSRLIRFAG